MLSLEQCRNKKFLVFGLGISGKATLSQLKKNKANVECWDDNQKLRNEIREVSFLNKNWFKNNYDFIVISPGINIYSHVKNSFFLRNKNKIITDLDLFFNSVKDQKIILVTGTNGKSTMCKLIYDLIKNSNKKVYLGGNYGTPVLDLPYNDKTAIFVIEISSYQLDYSSRLHSSVSVLLNVSPDHLERHKNIKNYILAKLKIFRGLADNGVGFLDLTNDKDYLIFKNFKLQKYNKKNIKLINKVNKIPLKKNLISKNITGPHFHNFLFIVLQLSKLFKISNKIYIKTIKNFKGLSHRQEIVKIKNNLTFINDSKATNFSSTVVALENYKNIHWIVGGQPKDKDSINILKLKNNIIKAYIVGKSVAVFKKKINKNINYEINYTIKNAFLSSLENAKKNKNLEQVILLSPAAASFDQFKNFEDRGNHFKELVREYL
jgi:UDP-N-acetylmuramoylalanine--D-glutamate ligase